MNRNRAASVGVIAIIVAAVALVLASGGSARRATTASPVVAVRQTALGKVLVGANGHTLYLFLADRPNRSNLSSAGLNVWPAFTASSTPRVTAGASRSKVRAIATHAGRQVTYAGHPLYYFVGDQKAGSTTGQGLLEFGARWYVVSPAGNAITTARPAPAPTTSEPSGGSLGY